MIVVGTQYYRNPCFILKDFGYFSGIRVWATRFGIDKAGTEVNLVGFDFG